MYSASVSYIKLWPNYFRCPLLHVMFDLFGVDITIHTAENCTGDKTTIAPSFTLLPSVALRFFYHSLSFFSVRLFALSKTWREIFQITCGRFDASSPTKQLIAAACSDNRVYLLDENFEVRCERKSSSDWLSLLIHGSIVQLTLTLYEKILWWRFVLLKAKHPRIPRR